MRYPKFRAWDHKKKEWIAKDFHIMGEIMLSGLLFDKRSLEEWNDVEITEFTGLKDRNRKDVYEGDILQDTDGSLWITIFKDGAFWFQNPHDTGNLNSFDWLWTMGYWNMVVIGNIFENPEAVK